MEIDSAYEAATALPVVEAKIGLRSDFLVRQLQYPYIWLSSVTTKRIIPILLCYSNGQFQLNEFSIGDAFDLLYNWVSSSWTLYYYHYVASTGVVGK